MHGSWTRRRGYFQGEGLSYTASRFRNANLGNKPRTDEFSRQIISL